MSHTRLLLTVTLFIFHSSLTPLHPAEPNPRRDAVVAAVEKCIPSVVNIATETIVATRDPWDNLFREFFDPYYRQRPSKQYSLGSGVIIDKEGFILTNYHVVARAGRVLVKLADGRELEAERIVGASATDLALLKIRAEEGETFSAVQFAEDDDLLLGETVLALGNPFGLGGSVSRGILSSKSRRPPREDEPLDVPDWLQTDAAVNPGNSGGPLINLDGEMIGINVAIYREGQGISFAIPIKRVSEALSEIYSPEVLESLWFGARVRPSAAPLLVTSVQLESPAGRAGLRAGDLILKVNGQTPTGFIDFNRQLLQTKDEKDISLLIEHNHDQRTLTFRLQPEAEFFNAALIRRKTGASVQETTPALAQKLRLPDAEGLLVVEVDEDSPAAKVALQSGMLITSLGGKPASSIVAVAKRLYPMSPDETVELGVIVPRRRGPFIEYHTATTELSIR